MATSKATAFVLDRRLSASQARRSADVKRILTGILKEAIVQVHQTYFYQVDFGPDVRPQVHIVSHDLYLHLPAGRGLPGGHSGQVLFAERKRREGQKPAPGLFPNGPAQVPLLRRRSALRTPADLQEPRPRLALRKRRNRLLLEAPGAGHSNGLRGEVEETGCRPRLLPGAHSTSLFQRGTTPSGSHLPHSRAAPWLYPEPDRSSLFHNLVMKKTACGLPPCPTKGAPAVHYSQY